LIDEKAVDKALQTETASERRILVFAALLAKASGSEVIVVGGSAIEVYTRGGYVSGDIDIVGEREPIVRVLKDWSFKSRGRLWTREKWELAVEVVGPRYTGSYYRTSVIETPHGPVRVAAIEDLIIKRLAEAKHWRVRAAVEEAESLWKATVERIDTAYLETQAKAYHVSDILTDFRRRLGG
jgi:hypothetical protein